MKNKVLRIVFEWIFLFLVVNNLSEILSTSMNSDYLHFS